jgi:predicted O-methyltransferase YrrM
MMIQDFLDQLGTVFPGDPQETDAGEALWSRLTAEVNGFTSANELAVLNLAARLLPEDECYVEVGAYKGRSICGAVQGVSNRRFYAIENYVEFGMLGQEAREELSQNLRRYAGDVDVDLIEGDCFEVLSRDDAVDRPVGVYFYDGAHTGLAHYLALGVVEPLLADEALVLVDDASWPMVQRAHRRYFARHRGWEVVRAWDARTAHEERGANGLHVLAYRRPAGRQRGQRDRDVEWRRLLQVHARGPATRVIWKALHRYPGLVPIAKRVVPVRSRTVPMAPSSTRRGD